MRGITSGLQPRRYADGDLVQKALDLGVTPFGMSDEEIMEAIVEKRQTDDISGASADFGEATEGFTRQVKENFFDYTDPLEYATLPFVSLKAAKLLGKPGKAVYNAVRGPASQLGGKISQNIRGIGAYIGSDILTRDVLGYQNPFGEEAKQARQDAQDEAAEDLKFITGKLEGEDFVDFELNAEGKKQKGISLIDPDKPMKTGMSPEDMSDEITSKLSPKDKEERMMKGIAALFEAYGESQSGGGASLPGGPITTRAIDTPEITRYQNGGIADMMPQDPMMMADGGIAHFALGGAAIKKAIAAGVKKGISALNKPIKAIKKEAKAIKEARKTSKASTKKSDSTDLVLYDDAAAAARTTRAPSAMDAFPPLLGGTAVATGKALKATGKMLNRNKGAIGAGVLGYGLPAAGAYGLYKAATGKDDDDGNDKGKDLTSESAAKVKLPDSLRDFHLENSMARAQAAGRDTPNFVDYAASFPKSYTDKLGSDPEFAKQMMAGFMAMMKPTEGFVPRNAFVDFGEAAMAEGARQEGQIPEALKTLQALEENPTLKAAYLESKRSEISPADSLAAGASLMSQVKEIAGSIAGREIKPKENLVTGDGSNTIVTTTDLIILFTSGGLPAVKEYAQTLVPEKG